VIVGERGPAPKATPTYPELCCHSLEDLDILNTRDRQPFAVSEEARRIYETEIIPFWKGRTIREKLFAAMSRQWLDAFEAGVFTEFMEQRAPGHAILDDKIYRKVKGEIQAHRARLDPARDPDYYAKSEELKAMEIAIEAIIILASRHAELARELAERETDPARRAELLKIADVCSHVPAHAPRDFHEALQAYWFVHLGVISELNTWDSFNPGRLDLNLYPFYRKGLDEGTLTKDQARELLECFWMKFNNQPAPPKVGITEEQSGTYTDFALINIGGLEPDGSDAVNELSYLLLDVVEEMQLVQPSACIQLSKKNPDAFLRRALEVVRTGFGQPSIFNTDVIIAEMLRAGKSIEDARCGGPSGCVTISAFGKESCTLTGYMNWPKILELTLHNGRDPRTGKQLGPQTGDPTTFTTYDHRDARPLHVRPDERLRGESPRLPRRRRTLQLHLHPGRGHRHHNRQPRCRLALLNQSPRYGNDDDAADQIAVALFNAYFEAIDGRPNTKGGHYRINLLPTTVHIYFGQVTGASPNGRKAAQPVSEGISPSQGADTRGPTAVFRSAAKLDHARTGGTLLNMKFTPELLAGDGLDSLAALVRSYFRLDGHHVQFNVVTADTLRKAQREPERYRNLIVRVAGYSDYFVQVGRELQDEIISRTEHCSF